MTTKIKTGPKSTCAAWAPMDKEQADARLKCRLEGGGPHPERKCVRLESSSPDEVKRIDEDRRAADEYD